MNQYLFSAIGLALNLMLLFSQQAGIAQSNKLTLKASIDSVLKSNYGLVIAKNEREIAENIFRIRNSALLPNINLGADHERSLIDTRLDLFNGEQIIDDGALNTNLLGFARLDYTIFDGFAMFALKEQAEVTRSLGEAELKQKIEETIYQTSKAFLGLAQQQKVLELCFKSIEISRLRYDLASVGVQIGTASPTDLRQALNDINADTSTLLLEQLNLKILAAELYQLFGKPLPPNVPDIDAEVKPIGNFSYTALQEELLFQNPQIMVQRQNLRMAEAMAKETRGGLMPTVNLFGEYRANRFTNEAGFVLQGVNRGPGLGVSMRWDLFSGLTQKRTYENRKLEAINQKVMLEDVKLTTTNTFLVASENYKTYLRLINLEKQNLEIAQENLDLALERFKLGSINDLELREFQRSLIDAELRLVAAEINTKVAELDMLFLAGKVGDFVVQ